MSEWISVKDKLPDLVEWEWVLVTQTGIATPALGLWNGVDWETTEGHFFGIANAPEFWMPLPKSPELQS